MDLEERLTKMGRRFPDQTSSKTRQPGPILLMVETNP